MVHYNGKGVFILGVGIAPFGKQEETPLENIGAIAINNAIDDAQIEPEQIQAAFCAHSYGGRVAGQRAMKEAGISGIKVINCENACSGGATAFHLAYQSVVSGQNDLVLAIGMDKMSGGLITLPETDYEAAAGKTLPSKYALRAVRYMHQYGMSEKELALVSLKNRGNGVFNPKAHFQKAITLDEIMSAKLISYPFTLPQCCPNSDGAAAIIIGSKKWLPACKHPAVEVCASVVCSGKYQNPVTANPSPDDEITVRTATKAFQMAGCTPKDIDVAEVHDAFTIGEVLAYENIGLCGRGESRNLLLEGRTQLDGDIPVNPSGGLISRGHPLGATGACQLAEITLQLREQAGAHQIKKRPRLGLTHCTGGSTPLIGTAACSIHILGTC
ncbi:thiolase family protein [Candidatus Formimonas warabiya]|uniref:propanoyl-CoA C-acyltransferase n=1 Tax=Formimonas warabiya TaxID=1761012 RepID=A0A3G1KMQ6_FORW1|nr:thiolase family protein [Candidatus Formimonas warabiya]ATW23737.1 hypothetical protein DCMF_02035 [Candidatus Formimonas warabiya]